MVFGVFEKTLDYAVNLQILEKNVAKQVKAIPKGRVYVDYWTKSDFEKVISKIYIGNVYDHLSFVMLWVFFNTGVRLNERCALW